MRGRGLPRLVPRPSRIRFLLHLAFHSMNIARPFAWIAERCTPSPSLPRSPLILRAVNIHMAGTPTASGTPTTLRRQPDVLLVLSSTRASRCLTGLKGHVTCRQGTSHPGLMAERVERFDCRPSVLHPSRRCDDGEWICVCKVCIRKNGGTTFDLQVRGNCCSARLWGRHRPSSLQ